MEIGRNSNNTNNYTNDGDNTNDSNDNVNTDSNNNSSNHAVFGRARKGGLVNLQLICSRCLLQC